MVSQIGRWKSLDLQIYEGKKHTNALKEMSEPLKTRILSLLSGIEASTMHTRETHWFLLSESPTNTNLLFLSFSSSLVALNLLTQQKSRHDSYTTCILSFYQWLNFMQDMISFLDFQAHKIEQFKTRWDFSSPVGFHCQLII